MYAIKNTTLGIGGYLTPRLDVHFAIDLNQALMYESRAEAQEALMAAEARFEGHSFAIVPISWRARIYHGGRFCGLGCWAEGAIHRDRDYAAAEGERLARNYAKRYGTDPVVGIEPNINVS